MIVNTADSALLEELATHSNIMSAAKRAIASIPSKEEGGSKKTRGGRHAALRGKMNKMSGLSEEEIKKAVDADLIASDQTWSWTPLNMDCLRTGLKDIENGKCNGPYSDIDELVLSLKP